MLIKTQIVTNKNTQQIHKGYRLDKSITNIKTENLLIFYAWIVQLET